MSGKGCSDTAIEDHLLTLTPIHGTTEESSNKGTSEVDIEVCEYLSGEFPLKNTSKEPEIETP